MWGAGHDLGQSSKAGIESLEEGEGACLWDLLPKTISTGTADKERPLGSIEKGFFPLFSPADAGASSLPEMV